MERSLILPHLIAMRAWKTPDAPYLDRVEGGQLSYAQCHSEGLRWASGMERLGLAAGQRVVAILPTGFDTVLAWLGATWLRATYVPINTAYRGNILRHVLATAASRLLLIDPRYEEQVADQDLASLGIIAVVRVGSDTDIGSATVGGVPAMSVEDMLQGASAQPRDGAELDDIACVTFTSGTTGASKGVLVNWPQLHSTATAFPLAGLIPSDAYYSPLPLFHVGGQTPVYLMALTGGRAVLREQFNTAEFFHDVETFGCTCAPLLESMANFLVNQPPLPTDGSGPLQYVGMVPVPDNVDRFQERFGIRVTTVYNQTELGTPISADGFSVTNENAASAGRLRSHYEARIVDEDDYPVAPGAVGELVVRSREPGLITRGYLGDPEASVKAWRNGWFHTGDAFRMDENGNFYFVDRRKDCIRRRGENISSREVEVELLAHPDIAFAAVVPRKSPYGEDDVKAFLVLKEGKSFDGEALMAFLQPRLPAFMIPTIYEPVDSLPMTPTHKVQKHLLKQRDDGESAWTKPSHR